jgi:hypothetical protein
MADPKPKPQITDPELGPSEKRPQLENFDSGVQ